MFGGGDKDMKTRNWKLAPVLGALILALFSIPGALAQCGMPTKAVKPASWNPQIGAAHLMWAAMTDDDRDAASIVGMWHVTFTAKTSNGSKIPAMVIDNALAVWHADKTEIMNSVRPPQDGNFCLGVWEQTGKCTYLLNHFAWFANQFPNDTNNGIGDPVGPSHFVESVTVSPDGDHFSGTFSLDAYDTAGNKVQSFTGTLSGTRITTRTTVGDLL
jgi:hypothetical protein